MLNSGHPDDERLAALAAGDIEAVDAPTLRAHVEGCSRCAEIVDDVSLLRAALAELPDVAPHRPLRLVPPVEAASDGATDSIGVWVRRLFAPVLTAGAALALVGMVGTALPGMQQGASGGAPGAAFEAQVASEAPGADEDSAEMIPFATTEAEDGTAAGGGTTLQASAPEDARDATADRALEDGSPLPAERSPWPMVLFTGVALMIGAATLRWILAGRAG